MTSKPTSEPRPPIYPAEWLDGFSVPRGGQTLTWHPSPGRTLSVSVPYAPASIGAVQDLLQIAKARGYTPPRWWQWWRWTESKEPIKVVDWSK